MRLFRELGYMSQLLIIFVAILAIIGGIIGYQQYTTKRDACRDVWIQTDSYQGICLTEEAISEP